MKTTLFSTIGAIALTSLAITLTPNTASAHESRGGKSSCKPSGRSCRTSGRGHCDRLPHGCRETNYRGHHCWYGGGHYYDSCSSGGYVMLDDSADTDTEVVSQQVDTSYASDDDSATVSILPSDCETVYVGGERCWYHDGCYYHRCGHGYTRTRCHDGGHGKVCKGGHRDYGKGRTCSTKSNRGTCNRNSGSRLHSSGKSSGHSGGHGKR